MRCLSGAVADPLGIRAVYFRLRAGAARSPVEMAALLIILFVTIGLAVRTAVYSRQLSAAESESSNQTGLVDACAGTFILVLLSLLGLLALGIMYGNVLGSASRTG